jgi:hypothetical protein
MQLAAGSWPLACHAVTALTLQTRQDSGRYPPRSHPHRDALHHCPHGELVESVKHISVSVGGGRTIPLSMATNKAWLV